MNHTVNTANCGISFLKDCINSYNPSFHHSSLFPSFLIFFQYSFSFFVSPFLYFNLLYFIHSIFHFIIPLYFNLLYFIHSIFHFIIPSFHPTVLRYFLFFFLSIHLFFFFFLFFYLSFVLSFFLSVFLFLMISVLRAKCYLEHREKR